MSMVVFVSRQKRSKQYLALQGRHASPKLSLLISEISISDISTLVDYNTF